MTTKEQSNAELVGDLQAELEQRGYLPLGSVDEWGGRATRAALESALGWPVPRRAQRAAVEALAAFRGDIGWVHAWEGHNGRPYWPGNSASGVTLDPGFDLGHQDEDALRLYYSFLRPSELAALAAVLGLRGAMAGAAARKAGIESIRISRDQAARVMPALAAPYWAEIVKRFPSLATAPAAVQTALLSLAYNRGPNNRHLDPLSGPLAAGDWDKVAAIIAGMQQSDRHQPGVRRRRRAEAELIRGNV